MTQFVLRRLVIAVVSLVVISILIFLATQALPGDAAEAILGRNSTPESVQALRDDLGLDRPLHAQYGSWVGGLLSGDLGTSLATRQPVRAMLTPRLQNSMVLLGAVAALAIPVSYGLGIWTAARRDRPGDRVLSTVLLVLVALPEFVIGIGLTVLLATGTWRVLPAVSVVPHRTVTSEPDVVVLPALTLALVVIPYLTRMVRASMVEVLESDYIGMARLNGVDGTRILVRHALPNGLAPSVQVVAAILAYLMGGVVIVETVFSFPGIGLAMVEAVRVRDLPVIQLLALSVGAAYILLNVVADVVTVMVTPRLRTSLS